MKSKSNDSIVNRWNTISYVVVAIFNFLIFSVSFRFFEKNEIGLFVLLLSIFVLGGNLDLGFGISTIKEIASAARRNDREFIRQYFFTFLIGYFILGILILLLQYLYFNYSFVFIEAVKDNLAISRSIFLLLSVNFIFAFMFNYLRCFLEGLFEYLFLSRVLIIINLLNFILTIIATLYFHQFILYVMVTPLVSVITFIVLFVKVNKIIKHEGIFKLENFKFSLLKVNLRYSSKIQISFFIGNCVDYIIKYLITMFLSVGFVAIYEAGKKFITFINGFIYSSQKILLVKLGRKEYADQNEQNENVMSYSATALRLTLLFYAILNPAICIFLYYWFGSVDSVIVFLLLALPQTIIGFQISLYNVIIIEGNRHYLITIQLFNLFMIIILCGIWLYFFKSLSGLLGYYLATIFNGMVVLYYFKKFHSLQIREFLNKIGFIKIILLTIIILIQTGLITVYNGHFITIMISFQIVFLLFFYHELIWFLRKFKIFSPQNFLKV